jgi:2-polyprenyl-3-methyl-5-hydroxy-6-metoxy-1,4-benzoquinol methylase
VIEQPEFISVKEMMFGTGDTFKYFICPNCNCLQIDNPPDDIKKYYPEDYYTKFQTWDNSAGSSLKNRLGGRIAQTKLFPLIAFLNHLQILNFIHYGKLKSGSKILDVGCGNGDLLADFYKFGFSDLTGIDPFLNNEYKSNSINLYKKEIGEVDGKFDLIIFNHSFEHVWDQHKTINKAMDILSNSGTILLRIPVLNYAFEKYRENWVQLDAPRHFYLYSEKSMNLFCEKNGLKIGKIIYDSTEFQFMGSEQYK